MALELFTKEGLRKLPSYGQFERAALLCVMFMIGTITAYGMILAGIRLVADFALGEAFLEKAALQDALGLILTVAILLEFNH